jgi:hypothetical protein
VVWILVMLNAVLPLLVSVMIWTALEVPIGTAEKARDVEDRATTGAKVTPVPVNPTIWGLPVTLSLIVSVPLRVPVAFGLNVTLMAHVNAGERLAGQLFVCAKSPETWILLTLSAMLPVLDRVIVWATLVDPTGALENERLEAVSDTKAPKPLPLKLMIWADPAASS